MASSPTLSERFAADHERLAAAMSRVVSALEAGDGDAASRLWSEFTSALSNHLEAEEHHVIPALVRRSERKARVFVQEHRHIRSRVEELDAEMASRRAKPASFRDFSDELRAHGHSEERLLYQWADVHLDETERLAAITALEMIVG